MNLQIGHTPTAINDSVVAPSDSLGRAFPSHRIDGQEVIVGDCLAVMATMPACSVDVVVTSPPYNIGIAYQTYHDRLPRDEFLQWVQKVAASLARVMRSDASLFLNLGATGTDPWIAMDAAAEFRKHFTLQNQIVWVKSISIGSETSGHFKPITSKRFLNNNHETIFHFTKGGTTEIDRLAIGVPFKDKSNISRWGHQRDRRCAGNTWFIPYETVRSRRQKFDHPAGYPVELAQRCILLHGGQDAIVFDPFLGAGTTLVAAKKLGRRGVGIEIDAHYARVSLDRLGT